MALHTNGFHIIDHCMDTLWSVDLAQNYFSHPDCLVVECLVHAVVLSPDSTIPGGSHVIHFMKFFPGGGPHA